MDFLGGGTIYKISISTILKYDIVKIAKGSYFNTIYQRQTQFSQRDLNFIVNENWNRPWRNI